MTKPRLWPRCWHRVPARVMRAIGQDAHRWGHSKRKTQVQCASGLAGHELWAELMIATQAVSDDPRERARVGASMLYGLAELGDYVGEMCCRRPRCTREAWPTFDGVCFEHGMFPSAKG